MLQQTRAKTVLNAFPKFLNVFPTLQSMAQAHENQVLDAWAGLGYYKRAKNLKTCVNWINQFGWPKNLETLLQSPGIGAYTAGALLSLAWNIKIPAIDTNVRRILQRYIGETLSNKPLHTLVQNTLHPLPNYLVGTFSEALIELGALICTFKNPKCIQCPIQFSCIGQYKLDQFNKKKSKIIPKKIGNITIIHIPSSNQVFCYRRNYDSIFPGLLSFPLTINSKQNNSLPFSIIYKEEKIFSIPANNAKNIPYVYTRTWNNVINHTFNHFHLQTSIVYIMINYVPPSLHYQFLAIHELYPKIPTFMKKATLFLVKNISDFVIQ